MVILSTMLRELTKRKAPGLSIYEYFCDPQGQKNLCDVPCA